jgi:hypothetical protein
VGVRLDIGFDSSLIHTHAAKEFAHKYRRANVVQPNI